MKDAFLALKTDQGLLNKVERAAARGMTSTEMQEQRVSYIYGTMDSASNVTRDQVRQLVLKQQSGIEASGTRP